MKKKIITLSLASALALTAASAAVSASSNTAVQEKIHINNKTETVDFIYGELTDPSRKHAREIVLTYLEGKQNLYKIAGGSTANFTVLEETRDKLGMTNVKLQQIFKGVPVYGHVLSANIDKDGVLKALSGTLAPDLFKKDSLKKAATLKPSEASSIALTDLQTIIGPDIVIDKQVGPKLVVYVKNGEARYAFNAEFQFLHPEPGNYQYLIDAKTGEVLEAFNQIHGAKSGEAATAPTGTTSTATGRGVLGDAKSFTTWSTSSGSYLTDKTRGNGIYTYDAKNRTRLPGTLWLDADNSFYAAYDAAAVDAHSYAAETYDYFKEVHNRNSYDGNGAQLISTVHYGRSYNNAFWNGSQMVYGDGDGVQFVALSGGLDVVAHELTHAVTDTTADLIYQNESGAINESMSDIFGTIVEYHANNHPDWQIGEDIYTPGTPGDALRSMEDPTLSGDPDHYSKRYTGTGDNGGVHINSGISNKAAYLLANGGTHYGISVTGIGNAKTADIFYWTLTKYLTPSSNYNHYRIASIQAATDLYGLDSSEVASVKAAFSAVGVN